MPEFCHLHCHTQYSLLDGASEIGTMMDKAMNDGQKGVALTDHGNMFGAFKFVAEADKRGIKPLVGCEFYLVDDRRVQAFSRAKGEKDRRYHQLMLAKNKTGYQNLAKLCSLGYIEGLYGKYPRIDKELLVQYSEGVIASSCCIGAEIPQLLLQGKDDEAETALKWWLDVFGDDYYIELQRHRGLDNIDNLGVSQEDINQKLIGLARKHNVKMIATNDSHYVEEEDFMPHDILLCVNTGSLKEDMSRFKFPSSDFYFKSQREMSQLFKDVPDSVANTMEIFDKVDHLKLTSDVLLPNFPMPAGFASQDDYLRHLTYQGAKKRYGGELNAIVTERLDFELEVIKASGYPGYFLIVQDFTDAARKMSVSVGPGRGSAAGSAVAYCTGITNIDPIKYDLLFERFLNPERVSMPDIDIDFDDVGRQKVIDYVIDKYGQQQVAQIITYGTMAARSSLRDVGRVMDVPLGEVDRVAKSFPSQLGATLRDVLAPKDIHPKLKSKLNGEDTERAYQFRKLSEGQDEIGELIRTAAKLEGSIRNTGVHACGVVITPSPVTDHVPVTADKDTGMYISQFDNSVAEIAGLLKMDFLGLKTLSIIKDALAMIAENHPEVGLIDIDEIPLDDQLTYELFQRGETNGIFQYESGGMQKHMKSLKPTTFDDLIAMNALYRPGPLEYIPEFIERKHGRKPIVYDLDAMEEYLHETYGICVTGDTLVHDAETGNRVRIDKLEHRTGEFVCQGVDSDYRTATGVLTHWVCNGKKPVYQVTLRSGKRVKMTGNHRLLTEEGWQELRSLTVGDYIGTPRRLAVEEKKATYGDLDRIRVLAYLLADGSLSSVGPTADFVNKSPRLISAYKDSLKTFERLKISTLEQVRGVTRVMVAGRDKTHYHETNSLVAWLRELGLKTTSGGCTSDTKFIPEFVFGLDRADIAFFLACYWDCDGYVGKKLVHVKTISLRLAEGIQTLLLRLGIASTIYESNYRSKRREGSTTAYQVTVYDLAQFDEKIGWLTLEKSFAKGKFRNRLASDTVSRNAVVREIRSVWRGSDRGLSEVGFDRQNLLPSKLAKHPRIGVSAVKAIAGQINLPDTNRALRIKWDEISSINYLGEELVYDITVSGIHNYVGNNVLLHNCVYQEQVMLLSQKLAGFSKGQADTLRKAMGKKQKAVLDKMYPSFIEGGKAKGHPEDKLGKIWKDWEAFASYAFNKSHSTCYAFVAYQTAYLKAHYPAEYMASVLTHNRSDIGKLTFFLKECKRMGVPVLGPDINESKGEFAVNKKGAIRIGMTALKGVGEGSVEEILRVRQEHKTFSSVFHLMQCVEPGTVNKRVLEALVDAGAFDCFESVHRAQYFAPSEKYDSYLEHVTKYANAYQSQLASAASSLFGAIQEEVLPDEPEPPQAREWNLPEKLNREKEVTGIYVSGHPLDGYRLEIDNYVTCSLADLDPNKYGKITMRLAGMISGARHMVSKNGNGWGIFELSDFEEMIEFKLFGEDYEKYKHVLSQGKAVFVKANYRPKWNSDEVEIAVSEVKLLEGIGREMTEAIILKLPLRDLSSEMVVSLDEICQRYQGKQKLKIVFYDADTGTKLKMYSRTRLVDADTEFINAIEGLGIRYRVA